ncbi:hypothetical protein CKO25_09375 [Thiocapsa imhoffii]|uniref:DDE Tnp4 domain-containing protein n=1 Tax=Thiocapsa imhoffii TaxID=382777 RepID=A0A9X1B999_9GAMM|nr:hypothetical protein [Thiocapsa imhoffii]
MLYSEVLNCALESLNVSPMRTVQLRAEFKNIVKKYSNIIADGTEVACVRPSDDDHQMKRYSGKKRHTVKVLTLTNHDLKLLYMSPVFGGSVHDDKIMKKCFPPNISWFEGMTLRDDLGFLGAVTDY